MERLPPAFVDRMTQVLGSRERLDELLEADSQRGIRVNRLKTTPKELVGRLAALDVEVDPVPWSPDAYHVHDPHERALGSLWEHRSGRFFVQDPISSLPVEALDVQPGETVLDLCAAPGSKTTHIAEKLDHKGLVVANDRDPGRVNNLISNLDQTGALTAVATQSNACRREWPIAFDKVLVDAPCSNLGNMHRDWRPVERYDRDMVEQMAGTQRTLLASGFHAARPGGRIVYSTCTIEPAENEAVVDWFIDEYPVEIEEVDTDVGEPAMTEAAGQTFDGEVQAARRVWAGEEGTESFFVAAFTKQGERDFENPRRLQGGGLDIDDEGVGPIEEIRQAYGFSGTVLDDATAMATASKLYATTVPDTAQALEIHPDRVGAYLARPETRGYRLSFGAATLVGGEADRRIELTRDQARRWLAGETLDLGAHPPADWSIVTCEGEALGCARAFGTELPCYVPKRYRSPDEPEHELFGFLAQT